MNLEQAKAKIEETNPGSICVEVAPGYFHFLNFTYSEEERAVIFWYDDVFGEIYYPDNGAVFAS